MHGVAVREMQRFALRCGIKISLGAKVFAFFSCKMQIIMVEYKIGKY